MTPLTAVAIQVVAQPAPVLLLDTCCLLDCLRSIDEAKRRDLTTAKQLSSRLTAKSPVLHVVVSELVPGEYQDNERKVLDEHLESRLSRLEDDYDDCSELLTATTSQTVTPFAYQRADLVAAVTAIPRGLLAQVTILARDAVCVDRALERLIKKQRPSHKKEFKDSLMLEHYLELTRQLRALSFTQRCVFASSNIHDFAERGKIHPDLEPDCQACGLEYFPSLSSALGTLKI